MLLGLTKNCSFTFAMSVNFSLRDGSVVAGDVCAKMFKHSLVLSMHKDSEESVPCLADSAEDLKAALCILNDLATAQTHLSVLSHNLHGKHSVLKLTAELVRSWKLSEKFLLRRWRPLLEYHHNQSRTLALFMGLTDPLAAPWDLKKYPALAANLTELGLGLHEEFSDAL